MDTKGYKNAPLVMALIDVRYTDIPGFEVVEKSSAESELHSQLSDLGFKHKIIENHQNIDVQIDSSVPQGNNLNLELLKHKVTNDKRWVFINLAKTTLIYISSKNIAIKTTDYKNHTDFISLFYQALSCVENVFPKLKGCGLLRIGTRYVNLIVPKNNKPLDCYIEKNWRHHKADRLPFNAVDGFIKNIHTNYETDHGMLRVECTQFNPKPNSPLALLPNDLIDSPETGLEITGQPWWNESFSSLCPYAALDIDLSDKFSEDFDKELIKSKLFDMRCVGKPAFEMCITEYARDEWEQIKEEV